MCFEGSDKEAIARFNRLAVDLAMKVNEMNVCEKEELHLFVNHLIQLNDQCIMLTSEDFISVVVTLIRSHPFYNKNLTKVNNSSKSKTTTIH